MIGPYYRGESRKDMDDWDSAWDEKDTRSGWYGLLYVEKQREASALNAVSEVSVQHCPLLISYSDLGYQENIL